MNGEKIEKEALELIAEFHSELYACVESFELGIIHDLLLDEDKTLAERKVICRALCAIIAQVTGGINITALLHEEKQDTREEMMRYFDG